MVVQKNPAPTPAMLEDGLRLAAELLPLTESSPLAILSDVNWFEQAINHPGGRLAQFLVSATGQLAHMSSVGHGLPPQVVTLFDAMAIGSGIASAMARVVLAVNAHYLLWLDPKWTETKLLPLFDWDRDPVQAAQVWHSLLGWGRAGASLLNAIGASATKLASHLTDLGEQRKYYGRFMARAAVGRADDPLSQRWFQAFLAQANDQDRAAFAFHIDDVLEVLRPDQLNQIWQDWLDRYLRHRADFPPTPQGKELSAIAGWALHMGLLLDEFVRRFDALPGSGADADRLLWKLHEGEPTGDASLRARLALALLRHCDQVKRWDLPQLHAAIRRLIEDGAEQSLIRQLIEKYLECGGSEPQGLLDLLTGRSA